MDARMFTLQLYEKRATSVIINIFHTCSCDQLLIHIINILSLWFT